MTICSRRTVTWRTPGVWTTATIWFLSVTGLLLSLIRHRLYWRVCNAVGRLVAGRGLRCVLTIGVDSKMLVLLDDPYWSRLLSASYEYEPEFLRVLHRLRRLEFDVLDCGANFGYWSVLLSGRELGSRDVVAVEPSQDTFDLLTENCDLNSGRFRCTRLAVTATSGRSVNIDSPEGHPGAHVIDAPGSGGFGSPTQVVTTTSLDDLVDMYFGESDRHVLVKLDVEGQEINALLGASRMMRDRDVLFFYEDFGGDVESRVTRFVLEELGLRVFFSRSTGELTEITSAAEASRLKTRKTYGYNFFACRDDSTFLAELGM